MHVDAYIARAFAEVQGHCGFKPDVKRAINRVLQRPTERDFNALRYYLSADDAAYVDIGANRGNTVRAARLFQPNMPIVAFEPNPILVPALQKMFAGDRAIVVEPYGLSDQPGTFELFVPHYKTAPFDGLASLHYAEVESSLNCENLWGFDPRHFEVRTLHCNVRRLDDFRLRTGFLKIDVQGSEAKVIAGGYETIERDKPIVLMENNRPEVDAKLLFDLGYERYAFVNNRLVRGRLGDLNSFYIHPRRRTAFAAQIYAD